jgi:peptidoglycan hydrolase-like protein with peptidoglycan-binding domain
MTMPKHAASPDLHAPGIDRLRSAAEPARRLARGETTVTRMVGNRLMKTPGRSLAWLLGLGATAAVTTNMLLLQPERHQFPMFAGNTVIHTTPVPTDTPPPPARPASLIKDQEAAKKAELLRDIQLELGRRGFYQGEPDPAGGARTQTAISDFQKAANLPVNGQPSEALLAAVLTSNLSVKSQILGVLRNGQADRLERPETVVAMQRALTKIGYGPLRDDGHFGAGTKAALDKFEKDRRLPGRGDNPTRVLRELSQASGIAIE